MKPIVERTLPEVMKRAREIGKKFARQFTSLDSDEVESYVLDFYWRSVERLRPETFELPDSQYLSVINKLMSMVALNVLKDTIRRNNMSCAVKGLSKYYDKRNVEGYDYAPINYIRLVASHVIEGIYSLNLGESKVESDELFSTIKDFVLKNKRLDVISKSSILRHLTSGISLIDVLIREFSVSYGDAKYRIKVIRNELKKSRKLKAIYNSIGV